MTTCTLAPTGPCTLTAGSACLAPKEPGVIYPLQDLFIQGLDDGFVFYWDVSTPYPTQTVTLLGRYDDGQDYVIRRDVPRDDGIIVSIVPLEYNKAIKYWIRPETATEYGEWQVGTLYTRSDWNNGGTPPPSAAYEITWVSRPIYESNKDACIVHVTNCVASAAYILEVSGPRYQSGPDTIVLNGFNDAAEFDITLIDCSDFAVGTITAAYRSYDNFGALQPIVTDVVQKITDNYLHAANGDLVFDTQGNPIPISGVYSPYPSDVIEHVGEQVEVNGEVLLITDTQGT